MKFLFIVQGEGRGHLTQALTLEEHLLREGHEVVEVLVGKSRNRELPTFLRQKLKAPLSRFESPNFLPTPKHPVHPPTHQSLRRGHRGQLLRTADRADLPVLSS